MVLDSVKVVREGLDVFSDFWLACGPLALYITWGFLDAFIQNYVRALCTSDRAALRSAALLCTYYVRCQMAAGVADLRLKVQRQLLIAS